MWHLEAYIPWGCVKCGGKEMINFLLIYFALLH